MSNDQIVIGHGAYRYRIVKDWGVPPNGQYPVKDCHEMVMDAVGNLYLLTNDTRNNIIVYNKDGQVMQAWGNEYPGGHGLTYGSENGKGFLLITDTERHEVIKTTTDGKVLAVIRFPFMISDYTSAEQYKPTETAIGPNGDIYVADGYGLQHVIQYSSTGEYIRHWGGRDRFDCAHGITVDDRDRNNMSLLITSRNHNCIRRFSLDGIYKNSIHLPGSFVCRPVIHNDNIYAAVFRSVHNQHPCSGYITILDANNKVVSTPGGTAPVYIDGELMLQRKDGHVFVHPHDVCVDDEENLYVPQWNSSNTYPVKLERIR
jgi:peptidylamidoglycolate lyase